jgi:hypothetical protein
MRFNQIRNLLRLEIGSGLNPGRKHGEVPHSCKAETWSGQKFVAIALADYILHRVCQNRIRTPYMTVCMVNSLLKIPYVHRIYVCMHGFGQHYNYIIRTGAKKCVIQARRSV